MSHLSCYICTKYRRADLTSAQSTDVPISHLHKKPMCSFGNQLFSNDNVLPSESADRAHDLQQIARITRPGQLALVVEGLVQISEAFWVKFDRSLSAAKFENLGEQTAIRRTDLDLVLDPTQEGFVHQFAGIEVRRKDDQLLERDGEFTPGRQRQEIDAFFQRKNPPVQQVPRTDNLPAEVVDQKDAAVGFDVQRRRVEIARGMIS